MINICFHGVGAPERELEPGEAPYWVSQAAFEDILDEVSTWPGVRLSFDDGNASDIRFGLPALLDRGLDATFFVLAGRLDQPGSLSSADVSALRAAGMTVGTHGMDHVPWRGLAPPARDAELVTARARIEEAAGAPVTEAACPLGRYDRRLHADLRHLGYTRVHTSDRRHARDGAWVQPRFSVRDGDSGAALRAGVLPRPPLPRRATLAAIGMVKSWR